MKLFKGKIGKYFLILLVIIAIPCLIPQKVSNPVEGAGTSSYNHNTFWHPWGDHHHHGVDIFAKKGTAIYSPISFGIVVATTKNLGAGGNTVSILGLHGRVYYHAHLDEVNTHIGAFVTRSSLIGTVGNTGNAKNTPAHCHFSILSIFPRIEHYVPKDERTKKDDLFKPFFVNPVKLFEGKQIW